MAISMIYVILVVLAIINVISSQPAGSPTMRPTLHKSIPVRIKVYKDSSSSAADEFWRHRGENSHEAIKIEADDNSAAFDGASKFLLEMPSLTGSSGSISFQSSDFADNYIRHAGYNVFLTQFPTSGNIDLYQNDASFYIVNAVNGNTNYISFQSENYPNHYIRIGNDNTLDIADNLDTSDKQNSASFKIICQDSSNCPKSVYSYLELPASTPAPTPGSTTTQSIPVHIQSYKYPHNPNYQYWVNEGISTSPAAIELKYDANTVEFDTAATFLLELPSLSGVTHTSFGESISFQSPNHPNYYVKSAGNQYQLFLNQYPSSGDIDLYKKESSFYIVSPPNGENDYISFRSVNYPGYYICYETIPDEGTYLYLKDAINFVDDDAATKCTLFKIICKDSNNCPSNTYSYLQKAATPAPTPRSTTQSISVRVQTYKYEHNNNYQYWINEGISTSSAAMQVKYDANTAQFIQDSTFLLELPSLSGAIDTRYTWSNSITFHSPNYENYYIKSSDSSNQYQLFVEPYPSTTSGKKDASFYVVSAVNGENGYISFRSVNYPDYFVCYESIPDEATYLYLKHELDFVDNDAVSKCALFKIICTDSNNCPSNTYSYLQQAPVSPIPAPTTSPTTSPTITSSFPVHIRTYPLTWDQTSGPNPDPLWWRQEGSLKGMPYFSSGWDDSNQATFLLESPGFTLGGRVSDDITVGVYGRCSFKSPNNPKYYIKHTGAGSNVLFAEFPSSSTDIDTFKEDASFWIVPALNGNPNYRSFMSKHLANHYLKPSPFLLKLINVNDIDTDREKEEASYQIVCKDSGNCPTNKYGGFNLQLS